MPYSEVMYSSKDIMWETPKYLFDRLNDEFNFTTDVCAITENAKCSHYFTPEDDGLQQEWKGVCWMNPPYSRKDLPAWVKKAYEEGMKGAIVVCLIPSRTDTKYWHDYCMKADEIRLIKGRVKFKNDGSKNNSAPFPSAVIIFRGKKKKQDLKVVSY